MPVRLAIGILLIVLVSLGIFMLVMSPAFNELALMALFLSITAFVSALVGYAAYRFGWIRLSPTLRWTLLAGYALASLLTFFNVWFSAQLMFASNHDLRLAIILLLFASGIAMILGYFLSSTVTERGSACSDDDATAIGCHPAAMASATCFGPSMRISSSCRSRARRKRLNQGFTRLLMGVMGITSIFPL